MKKLLLLTLILLYSIGFSQPITVSTTNYTVPQLVNNVLINSPCVSATNISWSTGTNFGSSNGIGYFQNTNPNFPMQSGVVLSTGSISNTPGPNTSLLNDGSTSWPGDSSLETTLAAAGINMVSKNASVLEFDFTPISPNFSFDFIFASEEYGNFQCLYSDAFAFLLTNMSTGVTTNLAVVPNTNLPISVVTIRDFQYNSSCPSVNPQYFGSFNGGSGAANSATNFNGQTKVLTASSVLTAGVPYHIKLVIADRADPQSDSAIFLSSDSFNIGQDVLGPDLTVANNTALCFGTNHTITTGLSATNYSFVWRNGESIIPGQTGPSLNVTQPGTYSVTYTNLFSTCSPVTDSIVIEYYPEINSPSPKTIYKCDMGAATYTYDLSQNTSVVTQGLPTGTTVSYFASQSDADNNTNALPLLYNSPSGKTIYVRIQLPNSQCYTTKSFLLQVAPPPVAHQAPNLLRCSPFSTAYFNFTPQTPVVLGSQSSSIYSVTYYTTLNNANNGTNAIVDPSYGNYGSTTIYVRVQNISDPGCFSVSSFNLIVNPEPQVDILQDVLVCHDYTLQPLTNGNYFTAIGGNGTPLFAGDVITQTQTIYIFNQPGGIGTCAANSSFKVTIVKEDELTPNDVSSCGSYTLPTLTYGHYYTAP
ncbi:MAG TPA: choice-of-anchor L domain-containing protein, partial [Flavobacterium sp.]|uniref:choice-of-anchor L domain-containing protein n=1 Tax=Flavobacterium sp. TaxID=239 RepID=UPI002CDCAA4E